MELVPHSSGEATSSRSHQLSKQRFTRVHDHLRHLYVSPLEAGHDAVGHEQLQLLVVQRAQSQHPFEHRQDVSDKAGLVLGEHHDTVDLIHCALSSRERSARVRRVELPRRVPTALDEARCGGRSVQVSGRLDAALAFLADRFSLSVLPDFLDWC